MWQRVGASVLGLGAFLMLSFPSIAGESAKPPVTFARDVARFFRQAVRSVTIQEPRRHVSSDI